MNNINQIFKEAAEYNGLGFYPGHISSEEESVLRGEAQRWHTDYKTNVSNIQADFNEGLTDEKEVCLALNNVKAVFDAQIQAANDVSETLETFYINALHCRKGL